MQGRAILSVHKSNIAYRLYLVTAIPLIYIAPVIPIKHNGEKTRSNEVQFQ